MDDHIGRGPVIVINDDLLPGRIFVLLSRIEAEPDFAPIPLGIRIGDVEKKK
jgi:hypothetical protein